MISSHHARALTGLADAHMRAGAQHLDQAARALSTSLRIHRANSDYHAEAGVRVLQARLVELQGDDATSHHNLQAAHDLYTDLSSPEADQVAEQLTDHQTAASREA